MTQGKRTKTIFRRAVLLMLVLIVLGIGIAKACDAAQRWLYPQKYEQAVQYWAAEYGVDPLLLDAFICTESGFDLAAESSVGARGLMQITEETFAWIKSKIAAGEDLTFDDLYKPDVNIRFGAYYVAACLDRYAGDVSTAAAAYHSGWGTVNRLLKDTAYSENGKTLDVFPYTQMQNYVLKITRHYQKYIALYGE